MPLRLDSPISVLQRGLLLVKGPDSHQFLQGQVTCDVNGLRSKDSVSYTNLGAHCTSKGRMLFSFRAIELDTETIALALPLAILESAWQALKKYSIFSKVTLIDASKDYRCLLLHRDHLDDFTQLYSRLPDGNDICVHQNDHFLIQLSEHYFECWLSQHSKPEGLSADYPEDDWGYWDAIAIELGLGEVRPQTAGEFIPQMLNLQAVANGISFTKGCYTGQEVVARMQYLGKLKRRMYRFYSDMSDPLAPGSLLYTPGNQQAIGHVVLSTSLNRNLLAVSTDQAVTANQVFANLECQYRLTAVSLPYNIGVE